MKMELDKKLDTIRLNVLAANFGDLATRRQMIQEFGDYPDALWGVNENGEKVMLSIRKKRHHGACVPVESVGSGQRIRCRRL